MFRARLCRQPWESVCAQQAALLLQVEGSDLAGRVEYGFDFYQSSAVPSEPADAVVAASEDAEGEASR